MFWKGLKGEILNLSRQHKIFIFCAMICSFCITADYGIVRPVSNGFFLAAHGSQLLPYAWIAVVPLNFLLVELYNRFLNRLGVLKMFFTIISAAALINIFCGLFMAKIAFLPFFFYVWKEIYVMLLFQQLWSVVHSTIQMQQARFLYGFLFAFGGLGGVVGSTLPGFFATSLGSPNLLFMCVPLFLSLSCAFVGLLRYSSVVQVKEKPIQNFWQGIHAIKNSKYLSFILAIVLLMQVTTTLIYYQFNIIVEKSILELDLRTAYCGRVMAIANMMTVLFQLFGSFLFVHFFGLKKSHILLPVILSFNALGSLLSPTFAMISTAFITIKAFDFSLFGVLKEMLYIPLKQEEKFQVKSIIDVFAYRSAKAIASCLILLIQVAGFSHMIHTLTIGSVIMLALWAMAAYKMFQVKDQVLS